MKSPFSPPARRQVPPPRVNDDASLRGKDVILTHTNDVTKTHGNEGVPLKENDITVSQTSNTSDAHVRQADSQGGDVTVSHSNDVTSSDVLTSHQVFKRSTVNTPAPVFTSTNGSRKIEFVKSQHSDYVAVTVEPTSYLHDGAQDVAVDGATTLWQRSSGEKASSLPPHLTKEGSGMARTRRLRNQVKLQDGVDKKRRKILRKKNGKENLKPEKSSSSYAPKINKQNISEDVKPEAAAAEDVKGDIHSGFASLFASGEGKNAERDSHRLSTSLRQDEDVSFTSGAEMDRRKSSRYLYIRRMKRAVDLSSADRKHSDGPFRLSTGILQGDSLSPIALASALKSNEEGDINFRVGRESEDRSNDEPDTAAEVDGGDLPETWHTTTDDEDGDSTVTSDGTNYNALVSN
jgi:hypothetical protein